MPDDYNDKNTLDHLPPPKSPVNTDKEKRVHELLRGMMGANIELYDKITGDNGFSYYFNELVKMAMK
jgi:hypothetical protein